MGETLTPEDRTGAHDQFGGPHFPVMQLKIDHDAMVLQTLQMILHELKELTELLKGK